MKYFILYTFLLCTTAGMSQSASEFIESLPSQFTPNGDGLNDTWDINFPEATSLDVKIYSRSGELVFKGRNGSFWDGNNLKNDRITQSACIYIITIELNGTRETFKGIVGIIK